MEIFYIYSRPRKSFGRRQNFIDQDPIITHSIEAGSDNVKEGFIEANSTGAIQYFSEESVDGDSMNPKGQRGITNSTKLHLNIQDDLDEHDKLKSVTQTDLSPRSPGNNNQAQAQAQGQTPQANRYNYIQKIISQTNLDCIPEYSETEVNTDTVSLTSVGTLHIDGAWPKQVESRNIESVMRYKRKTEKTPAFMDFVIRATNNVKKFIQINNAIDIYQHYFQGHPSNYTYNLPTAKNIKNFKDPNSMGKLKRRVTSIAWHPDQERMAVSYSLDSNEINLNSSASLMESYIWNLNQPNVPELTLLPSSPICSLQFNPRDSNLLIGGLFSGLVSLWDIRHGRHPTLSSVVESSHSDAVYSIAWTNSKTGMECVSVSTDGEVLYWDSRRLSEPIDAIKLVRPPQSIDNNVAPYLNGANFSYNSNLNNPGSNPWSWSLLSGNPSSSLGGTSMSYSAIAGSNRLLVGTEQGLIVQCNRKSTSSAQITSCIPGHHGPVVGIERHPVFSKIFMSVGDWNVRIWSEDCENPLITSKYMANADILLTGGAWSTTRASVFYTINTDGYFDVYDLLYRTCEPVYRHKVNSSAPLTCLGLERDGEFVAVGDRQGCVTLLQLSNNLVRAPSNIANNNDKMMMNELFERELKMYRALTIQNHLDQNNANFNKFTNNNNNNNNSGGYHNPISLKSQPSLTHNYRTSKKISAGIPRPIKENGDPLNSEDEKMEFQKLAQLFEEAIK